MSFLLSAFSGATGNPSSMRLMSLLVLVFVLGPRAIVAAKTGSVPPLTYEEVAIVLGALGIKAFQRSKETTPTSPGNGDQPQAPK